MDTNTTVINPETATKTPGRKRSPETKKSFFVIDGVPLLGVENRGRPSLEKLRARKLVTMPKYENYDSNIHGFGERLAEDDVAVAEMEAEAAAEAAAKALAKTAREEKVAANKAKREADKAQKKAEREQSRAEAKAAKEAAKAAKEAAKATPVATMPAPANTNVESFSVGSPTPETVAA